MHRIDATNAAGSLPTPEAAGTPGYFAHEDLPHGVSATTLTPDLMNAIQEEIAGVAEAAGLTLDKTNNAQLLAAVKALGGTAGRWARYLKDATQSIDAASEDVVDFDLKHYDEPGTDRVTTGAGWKYTADATHRVRVSAYVGVEIIEWTAGNHIILRVHGYIAGSPPIIWEYELGRVEIDATATKAIGVGGVTTFRVPVGSEIWITVEHNRTGGAIALDDPERCYVDIEEF